MTRIQLYQLIAVIILVGFVITSYMLNNRNDYIFYPIIIINLILWFLRLKERRQIKEDNEIEL